MQHERDAALDNPVDTAEESVLDPFVSMTGGHFVARVTPLYLCGLTLAYCTLNLQILICNGMVRCATPKTSSKVLLYQNGKESVV